MGNENEDEVDAQLRRILHSPVFASSARSKQFLEFCVNHTLRGQGVQLKETTIAVEVFLRAADYDPKSDPIVRVHARRVREKLDIYYRTVGADDPIKIDLPKGGYIPSILRTPSSANGQVEDGKKLKSDPADELASALSIDQPAAASLPASRGHWRAIVALVLVIAALCFAVLWMRNASPKSVMLSGALRPVDSLPGNISYPSWSPDGTRLAFAATEAGDQKTHVYIKDGKNDALPVRLTEGDVAENRPVWAPSGRELAFIQSVDALHFEIVRFDLTTKTAHTVGRFITFWPIAYDHPALDWSSDGRFLLTAEQSVPGAPMRIVLISTATGERTFLTSPPINSSGDIDAKFSPDGRFVAFRRGGLGDLYTIPIKGEQTQPATRLTFDTKGVRGIAWADHGRSILFGTQRGSTAAFGLWKVSASGGSPVPFSPQDFDAINPAVSSSGVLAFEHRQIVTELVGVPLKQDAAEHVLLPSDSEDSSPVYSPDGRSLVFTSTRTGWGELWLYKFGDAKPEQMTHFQGSGLVLMPSWSSDGKSVVFGFRQNGATNILIYDLSKKTIRRITSTANRDFSPAYSNDGKFIYFSSNDDGTPRIWRIRADGTERAEPLFLEAIAGFVPSHDDKWLYFLKSGSAFTLFRRSLVDDAIEEMFNVPGRAAFINSVSIANHHIYLAVSQDDPSKATIFEVDPEEKSSHVVAHLNDIPSSNVSAVPGFSVAPDGSTLLYSRSKLNRATLYTVSLSQ
jgi:Tol biopolymer transport system component